MTPIPASFGPHSAQSRNRPLAAAIAVALGLSTVAQAADTGDALQEIVVTANRREQNLIDVPYNISAVSGQQLQSAGITTLTDIARLLPGVNIPDLGPRASSSNSNIIIRGLNANDPTGSAYLPWESVPLVSTYVDEVPMFVNLNLADVQRVEVLRGPQGTLYGSGAVGGTIRIIHNQPDPSKFTAELSVDASSTSHAPDGSYGIDGLFNIPLSETAALRVNGGYKTTSGFIDAHNAIVFGANTQPALADPANPLTSNFQTQSLRGIDSATSKYARASMLWHVTQWLDATLAYQRQEDHSNAFSRQTQGQSYIDNSLIPTAPDDRTVDLDALTLTADFGFATLTSSTSYAKNHDTSTYDQSSFLLLYDSLSPLYYGNYPRPSSPFYTSYTDTSLVEELRLVSKSGGRWDYAVGGFFRHLNNDLFQYETVPGITAWAALPGSANAVNQLLGSNFATFDDYITQYNGGTPPNLLSPVDSMYTYARKSGMLDRALYGELTLHATNRWQITGGARIFWQNVSSSLKETIPFGGPLFSTLPPPANLTDAFGTTLANRDQAYRNHLFKLNTGYEISKTLRAYATFSEGFRHGGANANAIGSCAFCDSPETGTFNPDTVKNYEVGLKGTAGNWLRFSSALYRMRWSDIQIQVFDPSAAAYVANGGTARSQGLELELDGQLGSGWSAMLGYGYTDAKVTEDFTNTDRGVVIFSANNGDRLPYVPKQTVTAGFGYAHPVGNGMALDAHADLSYRSSVTTQINASAAGYQILGGFTTLNLSGGVQLNAHVHTRLYVNNLTNSPGVSVAGPVLKSANTFTEYNHEYVIRPRTIGVSLQYSFE